MGCPLRCSVGEALEVDRAYRLRPKDRADIEVEGLIGRGERLRERLEAALEIIGEGARDAFARELDDAIEVEIGAERGELLDRPRGFEQKIKIGLLATPSVAKQSVKKVRLRLDR